MTHVVLGRKEAGGGSGGAQRDGPIRIELPRARSVTDEVALHAQPLQVVEGHEVTCT